MTSPAVDTGIVAFIEARLDWRERSVNSEALNAWRPFVLATIAKDRAILALHFEYDGDDEPECQACNRPYPCQTVRLLAAIDADHSEFDPSWKPVAS